MDKQELYKKMQALWVEENGVKVGDKVKVLRQFGEYELGSNVLRSKWKPEKADMIGHVFPISQIYDTSISINSPKDNRREFPFFVLEIVDQPRDPEVICKFFAKDEEGKLVEYEMSPDSARNYHKAMGE